MLCQRFGRARAQFARENAEFEERLADARRRLAEGTLLPTPAALFRRWCEAPAIGNGLTGSQRLILTFMELDAAVGGHYSASAEGNIFPPAILGPDMNTDWPAVMADKGAGSLQTEPQYFSTNALMRVLLCPYADRQHLDTRPK